jgi:hypothetical protein
VNILILLSLIPLSLAGAGEVSGYLIADGKVSNMTTVNVQ